MDTQETHEPKLSKRLLAGAALAVVLLSACNTTEGFGEDVESTGEAIEDAADND